MKFNKSNKEILTELQPKFDFSIASYILFIQQCFKSKLVFCIPYNKILSTEKQYVHVNRIILILRSLVTHGIIVEFYGTGIKRSELTNWLDFCFHYGYNQLYEGLWVGHHKDNRFPEKNIQEFNNLYWNSSLTIKYLA